MGKKIKPLPNGRSASKDRGFARTPVEMIESAVFQSLAASAIKVLLWALWKNFKAANSRSKEETGKPVFTFTNAEARESLGMNQTTFSRGKAELIEKGFLEYRRRGGLRGVNGVASEFCLSGDWKDWSPKRPEDLLPHGKNLKSVTKT